MPQLFIFRHISLILNIDLRVELHLLNGWLNGQRFKLIFNENGKFRNWLQKMKILRLTECYWLSERRAERCNAKPYLWNHSDKHSKPHVNQNIQSPAETDDPKYCMNVRQSRIFHFNLLSFLLQYTRYSSDVWKFIEVTKYMNINIIIIKRYTPI
jgi:hypothetical protein